MPQPADGEALLRVRRVGICGTDLHIQSWDSWAQGIIEAPLIPGHEGVGIIEAVGEGDLPVAVGQRVALPWLGHACGSCRYCVDGWETYCTSPAYMGYTMDGSYAEYTVVDAANVIPFETYLPWDVVGALPEMLRCW